MRKNIYRGLMILGAVLTFAGILLFTVQPPSLAAIFIRPDLVPFGVSFLGIMLLLTGWTEVFYKKTRQEKIEEKDERNAAIVQGAMAAAFEAMNLLLGIALVTLAILGYMNHVSFFTLIICYLAANCVYLLRLRQLNREL